VLDLSRPEPILLRPGGVTIEDLQAQIGPIHRDAPPGGTMELRSPGLMVSHYAPSLPVRIGVTALADDEALLAFGPPLPGGCCQFQLSAARSTIEAASRLFEGLRFLDTQGARSGARGIAVMPIPDLGLGLAINDRLRRAAAPRIG
jgi:L-threonylcarbamoyladenylate synthase